MSAEIESLTNELAARRAGGGVSPMLVALVVLGLLLAAYAHWRFGQFADRIDHVRSQVAELRGEHDSLSSQMKSLATRLDASNTLRCTGLGGLAITRTAKKIEAQLARGEAERAPAGFKVC